ncbi:MAG: 2-oxoacid:acceptor oxidoreductase family protein, partial [Saccharofermentanales bacterium]
MDYNILIGGAAGQGMDTFASVFSKLLQRNGYYLFTLQDYMSRVRGGHNYFQIRFSDKKVMTHKDELDVIIALNQETLDLHAPRLKESGIVLADDNVSSDDTRLMTIPAQAIAKELGNPKIFSSIMLGALLQLFSLGNEHVREVFLKKFSEEVTDLNMQAFDRGQTLVKKIFRMAKGKSGTTLLMQSNEAIALGALAAGLRFYSAYPMTPSTSIMSYLTRQSAKAQIIAEQAEDEIAAVNMAIGASFAGARAMTSTSGGGFSLMVEAMGLAGIAEVPLVIAVIQRPGPATGLPTRTEQSDLKFVINSSQGEFPRMVIALRNPADAFYQTVRAFNLADKYQITVILLGDQYLSDAVQTVEPFDLDRVTVDRYLADDKIYLEGKRYRR